MDANAFTFTELERRIAAMPDGPLAVLERPRWQYRLDLAGGVAIIVSLLPNVLILMMTPAWWMVTMAKIGLGAMIVCFAPGFIRNVWVFARIVRQGRAHDVAQLDSDYDALHALQAWLTDIPQSALERHLRYIQMRRAQLAEKLSLLGGGLDRFGMLPLILAIAVQLKAFVDEDFSTPLWQIIPGIFLAIGYLVCLNASFLRVRMHLYEAMLVEALARREGKRTRRQGE